MESQFEVTHRPRKKLSHIPEEVVEHFATGNKAVMLNHGAPDSVAMYGGLNRMAVTVEDLNEDLVEVLKKASFGFSPDGTIKRGDCVLLWCNQEDIEMFRQEADIAWHNQSDPDRAAEELDQFARSRMRGQVKVNTDPRSGTVVDRQVFRGRRTGA